MLTVLVTCFFSLSLVAAAGQQAQTSPTPSAQINAAGVSDERLDKLPVRLRERGRLLLGEGDGRRRADLADELAREEPADVMEFLLALLDADSSALVRRAIVSRLGRVSTPQMRQALERHAASDSDVGVAELSLDRLRALILRDTEQLLLNRMELARRSSDAVGLRELRQEQERWIALVNGVMLPSFLRAVPPVFSVKAGDQPVCFLAFGDFGTGSAEQKRLAGVMRQFNQQTPFDFALTLGDNFYANGMTSPDDPRWQSWWEDLYGALHIKFYATLGNHDWYGSDSPAAEILYTRQSRTWRMPAPYYTFTAGPVQFFALDTNEMSEAQLVWLHDELTKSLARWKVVYGHHPIYSVAARGNNQKLLQQLQPILSGRADIYLTGHEHNLQHLKPEGGVHFFIVGGGGQKLDRLTADPRAFFAVQDYGFAMLEAEQTQFRVRFINADGKQLYEYRLRK